MSRADYAPGHHPAVKGGLIGEVTPGSPADRASLVAGDIVTAVDGRGVRDILDWRWATDGASISLDVVDDSGEIRRVAVDRRSGESWGVDFTETLFDSIRTCQNNCEFCFVTQLPAGLRKPLYVRDDDFRLSFLQGNFISLTNLDELDLARIDEQRLSPLYVSLHAVSPAVRDRLICARVDRALETFDRLLEAGIELHTQVVLVPGINDGAELDRTLGWLAARAGVASVGIVPLGYTRYQTHYTHGYSAPGLAGAVIDQVQPWQEAFRRRDGVTWVYLADELYLRAGVDVPPAEHYDDYPQFENGIGIVRSFIDDVEVLRPRIAEASERLAQARRGATVVTGSLAAPTLRRAVDFACAPDTVRTLGVSNDFFGGNVSVAGLLSGVDIVAAINGDTAEGRSSAYLVPDVILNTDGVTLDEMTVEDIAGATGADLRVLSCDAAGLLQGLQGLLEPAVHNTRE